MRLLAILPALPLLAACVAPGSGWWREGRIYTSPKTAVHQDHFMVRPAKEGAALTDGTGLTFQYTTNRLP